MSCTFLYNRIEELEQQVLELKRQVVYAYSAGWGRDCQYGIDYIDPLEEELEDAS